MRIHIVGAPGAGKTTLARRLAAALHCPHLELDAYYWRPNWTKAPASHFTATVWRELHGKCWVADGAYTSVRELIWRQADLVLWLDYPGHVLAWRTFWRGVGNIVHRTDLWGSGNQESWGWLLSSNSIVARSLAARRRLQAEYGTAWGHPRYGRLQFVHLASPQATRHWARTFLNARLHHPASISLAAECAG